MKRKPHLKDRAVDQGRRISVSGPGADDPENLPPKFCLRLMDRDYCVLRCEKEDQAAFATRLRELSQLTWKQIRQAPRHGLGTEIIPREAIRAAIPQCVTEDVNLIAFRFSGKKPMVGFRTKDGVFNVLFLDHNFTLYPH